SSGPQTITTWDTTTWKEVRPSRHATHQPGSRTVAFSPPDGKLLATAWNFDRTVCIWDATTGQEIHRLSGHTWHIISVAFDRTGRFVASAGADSTVRLWDVRAGKEVLRLKPKHAGWATSLAFSPDGRYLASASMDRTVKVWNARSWEFVRQIPDAFGGIQ